MGGKIKTKDGSLEVQLFDEGMVEVESALHRDVGIEIRRVDPSENFCGPPGALYKIQMYRPQPNVKERPFEYDIAWVMPDGTLVKRGEQRRKMSSD
jgi:hypothetical protein